MKISLSLLFGLLLIFCGGLSQAAAPQQVLEDLVASAGDNAVLEGKNGWLFLKEELRHLSYSAFSGETMASDPLPAIVDFNKQLRAINIDLLLVFIPPKALVYPDMLPGKFTEDMAEALTTPYKDLYAKLSGNGVAVLDLLPLYQQARSSVQPYCKTDSHYSGDGIELLVQQLEKAVSEKVWYSGVSKHKYTKKNKEISIIGDLSTLLGSEIRETLTLGFIKNSGAEQSVAPDPDSPLLLLGDSHTLVFSVGGDLHSSGAGLFDNLTAALQFPIDRIGVRGSGATPSRIRLYQRSRKNPQFLNGKKMVIWCLSGRELTGTGGWRKIPVAKK